MEHTQMIQNMNRLIEENNQLEKAYIVIFNLKLNNRIF